MTGQLFERAHESELPHDGEFSNLPPDLPLTPLFSDVDSAESPTVSVERVSFEEALAKLDFSEDTEHVQRLLEVQQEFMAVFNGRPVDEGSTLRWAQGLFEELFLRVAGHDELTDDLSEALKALGVYSYSTSLQERLPGGGKGEGAFIFNQFTFPSGKTSTLLPAEIQELLKTTYPGANEDDNQFYVSGRILTILADLGRQAR